MRHLMMLAAGGEDSASLSEAFKNNPVFLCINIAVSAVVITIIVERAYFQLRRYSVNSREFFSQVKKLVVAGNIDRAIKLCEASDYPVLQLVKSGLTHANKGADEIDAALSERLAELKPQIEKRVGALWSLANIATLVGLVGTVFGLIRTFSAISGKGMSQDQKTAYLSNGIAEAMYNTAFGLLIAVICMIAHVVLHTRAKGFAHDLETVTERVFNLLTISNKPSF